MIVTEYRIEFHTQYERCDLELVGDFGAHSLCWCPVVDVQVRRKRSLPISARHLRSACGAQE